MNLDLLMSIFHESDFIQIDFPALMTAILACLSCSLLGNFLVIKRQALLSDTLSHSVLPGIILGFIVSDSRAPIPMFISALLCALLASFLIEVISKYSQLKKETAMGIVYTSLFAFGVFLIQQHQAKSLDLDLDCILFGQLEHIIWVGPKSIEDLFLPPYWSSVPHELLILASVSILNILLIFLSYHQLKLSLFDPLFARTIGFRTSLYQYGLIAIATITIIACFEAIGSMVVIALMICPAATAQLISQNYKSQLFYTGIFGVTAALFGYLGALLLPLTLGLTYSLSAAGMIALSSGLLFLVILAYVLLMRHGAILFFKDRPIP